MKKEKNVTVIDIANYLNLSPSTVSRALNNNPKISQKTKEKVWEAAKKMGYTPNLPAYILDTTKRTVLILANTQDIIFDRLLQPLIYNLRKLNIETFVSYFNGSFNTSLTDLISNLNIAAVVVSLYYPLSPDIVDSLKKIDRPVFTLNTSDVVNSHTKIYIDYYYAGYLATKHVLGHNPKRIALVTEREDVTLSLDDLKAGINSVLINQNVDFNEIGEDSGLERYILDFDAVICTSARLTARVYCYLQQSGKNIPNDVLLVSIGQGEFLDILPIGITTVEFSYTEAIEKFSQSIAETLEGGEVEKEYIIPARLILKTSSLRLK